MTEFFRTIIWAAVIAVIFRTLLFEPFSIPSGSMIPTLLVGDYVFVTKASYGYGPFSPPVKVGAITERIWFTPPERGDVAVFRPTRDEGTNYIKRIIGLPGETIQVKEGILHINGTPVTRERIEDYKVRGQFDSIHAIAQYIETLPGGVQHRILEANGDEGIYDNTRVYRVPDGHYFMMGDNRDASTDSRDASVGFVPVENFVGRADIIFFSSTGAGFLFEFWRWGEIIRFERFLDAL